MDRLIDKKALINCQFDRSGEILFVFSNCLSVCDKMPARLPA